MSFDDVQRLPWRLWWTQVLAVVRLELRKSFLSRRSWWIYFLALIPGLLTAGHSLIMWHKGEWNHAIGFDSLMFAGVFQFGYLRLGIYFGCVILFSNVFRGEVLNKTLHYYFLAPIRREVLAAGKFLSSLRPPPFYLPAVLWLPILRFTCISATISKNFFFTAAGSRSSSGTSS